jgi:membrane dipeptidase
VDDHPRDVSDEVLKLVAANGGVVMVNYAPAYVSHEYRVWSADRAAEKTRLNAPPFGGMYIGEPDKAAAALEAWDKAHPMPKVTLGWSPIISSISPRWRASIMSGSDRISTGSATICPTGLEDVSSYPACSPR